MRVLLTLLALVAGASAFVPRSVAQAQAAAARAPIADSPRTAARTARSIFNRDKGPSEAEIAAERAAAQDRLNEQWAKESEQEFWLMSGFGVFTSLPIIYLLYLATQDDGGTGAGSVRRR